MAIGLAFVDILGDTSRTAEQVERDMNRVLAVVQDEIQEIEIEAGVEAGTEQELVRSLNQDIRAAQAAIQAVQVRTDLDPAAQQQLVRDLRQSVAGARARLGEIKVRVDARGPVEEVQEVIADVAAQVAVANTVIPPIEIEVDVDEERASRLSAAIGGIGRGAGSAIGPLGKVGGLLAGLGASTQSVFALVTSLQNIAPAAFLAAPALLSVQLAAGAIKLAMVGVGDAVKAALDPSDPEAFAEATKNLAPNAREFAKAIRTVQPALKELQQGVQNRVFAGFGQEVTNLSKTVLPQVRTALNDTGNVLNAMGRNASAAAQQVAKDGVLGQALKGTTDALANLQAVPANLVVSFTQLAATAAPQFERITAAIGDGLASITDKITAGAASGSLQDLFDTAIDQVLVLADALGNIAGIFGNITSEAAGFGGAFNSLQRVTQALEDFTATDEAQRAFRAIFETVNLLVGTALPVLGSALKVVGEVIVAIQPGVNALISALGPALTTIITALGPVLVSLAGAVGNLVISFAPLVTFFAQLVAAILPVLVPILDGLSLIFVQMAPFVQQLATTFATLLLPVLAQLPSIIQPIVMMFTEITAQIFPVLTQLLVDLQPELAEMAANFVTLSKDLAPVLTQIALLAAEIFADLIPVMQPIIDLVVRLASVLGDELATQINQVAVPALGTLSALLDGDASNATKHLEDLFKGLIKTVVRSVAEFPGQLLALLGEAAVSVFKAGSDIIASLMNGIRSKLGELKGLLGNVTDLIPDWKGPEERDRVLLTPAGIAIMDGLINGIESQIPNLQSSLGGITDMVGGTQFGVGGVTVPAAAAGFSSMSTPSMAEAGVPNVQVFVGTQQITDIVDVRLARQSSFQGRQVLIGSRR